MTQDTRKDRRVKIVSLNVRYKSATVDEFIENHSHDVSKGGIFIKTPTPFPPGTLIKFEIRIANDKAVIMGVGRVVWKREPSQSAGERPSGMGVKFIKIDDSSRQLIDRVVAEKEEAGSAYATENEADEAAVRAATRQVSERPRATSDRPRVVPGSLRPGEVRKETIMGIGASSPPPRPEGGGGMFPTTTSAPETGPVKEKTVMKQAAELLEEALKEAGGSMEEIGTNPLFNEANKTTPRAATVADSGRTKAAASAPPANAAGTNNINKKATLVGMGTTSSAPPAKGAASEAHHAAEPAKTASEAPKKVSISPPTARETPSAKVPSGKTPSARPASEEPLNARERTTDPPAARPAPARAADQVASKKSGSGGLVWLLVLLVVAGGVAFVYKDNLLGTDAAPPTVTATAPTPPTPTPAATPEPAPAETANAAGTASAAASASATPAASAATTAAASASASAKSASTSAVPTATAAQAPKPAPTPKPAPPPAPTAAATSTDTPAPAPPPKPKPKPKPAATSNDSDNPY